MGEPGVETNVEYNLKEARKAIGLENFELLINSEKGKQRKVLIFSGPGCSKGCKVDKLPWSEPKSFMDFLYYGNPLGWRLWSESNWEWFCENFKEPEHDMGHEALVEYEKLLKQEARKKDLPYKKEYFTIVTVNTDSLHQLAGSTHVLDLHRTARRFRCIKFGHVTGDKSKSLCEICGSYLRPDCVLFFESVPEDIWTKARMLTERLKEGDVCIIVGVSRRGYPASHIPDIARRSGAKIIEINSERVFSSPSDIFIEGSCNEMLRRLFTQNT